LVNNISKILTAAFPWRHVEAERFAGTPATLAAICEALEEAGVGQRA